MISPQKLWNKSAEAWVDFVRTGKDWARNELNNPAMFAILGNIKGKKVLDLACGEGYNTRILARKGAKVIGIDFAQKLIDYAKEQEAKDKLGINYYVCDASNLAIFKNNTFDIVTCFMALQDIENYQKAIKEVFRVLKKNGRFVFVISHPCFEARIISGKRIGGWVYRQRTENKETALNLKLAKTSLYYAIDRYFDTASDIIHWNMERLNKHFKTLSFHRTLTDYATALYRAGFLIARLIEPKPTKRGLKKHPLYFKENLRIPQSIVIEALKQRAKDKEVCNE
ncbi:MAG: class I SAM-dependent methyltransferase [candidate division WOR-3 bacterium]